MRHLTACIALFAITGSVCFAKLPTDVATFQKQIAEQAKEPKQAAKLWFDAIYVYQFRNKELGAQLITLMTKNKDWQKSPAYFPTALNNQPWIFHSYVKATKWEDDYKFDPDKYELSFAPRVDTQPYADREEGKIVKLWIVSSGADSPRPLELERNNRGEYKVREYSSVCVGVRHKKPENLTEAMDQSTDPAWVFKHWLEGIYMYLDGDTEGGGQQIASVSVDNVFEPRYFYGALSPEKAYIWHSYAKGTSVDDGYAVDPENFEVDVYTRGEAQDGRLTLWVKTTGGNADRPLKMIVDSRGQYRIDEFSSLCVGLSKVPKDPAEDDF